MQVYLAAPYIMRPDMLRLSQSLALNGPFPVCSSWVFEDHDMAPGTLGAAAAFTHEQIRRHVDQDIDDLNLADVVVLFTADFANQLYPEADVSSGGRLVEFGYALARGLPVILVGTPGNVFERTLAAASVSSIPAAILQLFELAGLIPHTATNWGRDNRAT